MKFARWVISSMLARHTEAELQRGEHEVFAIWAAKNIESKDATVERLIVPSQSAGMTAAGAWVHIPGAELQRIQIENFKLGERSIVQLHTHPGTDVRMSRLDREWEVVRHVGALSIIVPHYGRQGLSLFSGANIYEREESGWRLWSVEEAKIRMVML